MMKENFKREHENISDMTIENKKTIIITLRFTLITLFLAITILGH